MQFDFVVDAHVKIKTFLKQQDVSKSLLAKIKFSGGKILVNGKEENATYLLDIGDHLSIIIPSERDELGTLKPITHPLAIVYEDAHFLVVNKPVGIPSIPSILHSNTMANFVKGYYVDQNYENQQVHIVTRLDKDTTGLMLLAKHGYAHARLDKQLQRKTIDKRYLALVSGRGQLDDVGEIIAPIARSEDSIIARCVAKGGKYAHTSYKVVKSFGDVHLVDVRLHTGRTHQIRVHFAHIGFPLLGDDLYGGQMDTGIGRQALHCHSLKWHNPFSQEVVALRSKLPGDMATLISNYS